MISKRIAAATIVATAWITTACADTIAAPSAVTVPFAITDERRAMLGAALVSSRDEALIALADREAAAPVSAALARLADRVASNDTRGAREAIQAARGTLQGYRDRAPTDAAGAMMIEAIEIVVEHVFLAIETPADALY